MVTPPRRPTRHAPTETELRLLKVLWQHGPSTARDVHERLPGGEAIGYTTVLKMLQVMEQKGLVTVDRRERSHVFGAAVERTATLGRLAKDFVDRAFDGAMDELLVHLVDQQGLLASELAEIERKLAALRRREEEGR